MPSSAWSLYHPLVSIAYLVAALVISMAFMHPVLALCSMAAAVSCCFMAAGFRATCKMLAWQIPLLLVLGIANLVFSASGSTELFRIGNRAFYLEALIFGLASGSILVSVMAWFVYGNKILDSDQVLLVGARPLPVASLMVSMILRLVPQFVKRGTQVVDAREACTAATCSESRVKKAARQSTVLLGWAMEDSLETADAMRCRGWGVKRGRTSYESRKMRMADWVLLLVIVMLACTSIWCNLQLAGTFSFYPHVVIAGSWTMYLPYVALLLIPFALETLEWLRW